jgi:DNA-binding transcriptional LysR family regulator
MDLDVLKNFMITAREKNITHAAQILHISQPALSKQLKQLEGELGKSLFIRKSHAIELTPEGMILREKARDLLNLADRIQSDFQTMSEISGTIFFGAAESPHMDVLAEKVRAFKKVYPNIRYEVSSGDAEQIYEKIESGLLDIGLITEKPDFTRFTAIRLPVSDRWGLIMQAEDPLKDCDAITIDQLENRPLFVSRQGLEKDIAPWAGEAYADLQIEGFFPLSYNASRFVKAGLGVLLTFEGLIDTSKDSGLLFRRLSPALYTPLYFIRRKERSLSPVSEKFWETLQSEETVPDGSL